MFLTQKMIEELAKSHPDFILPFDPSLLKPVSYTFRLGGISGQPEVESVTLAPGQFLNLESMESIQFPDDIMGILSARGSIAKQGLDCLSSSTVIEPSSSGKQVFETKNHSDKEVVLKVGTPMVKCLFYKLG